MTSVLGYARTFFLGGHYRPEPLPTLTEELERFHKMLEDLGAMLERDAPLLEQMTPERLLQGPFSDAMTHAGQLALLHDCQVVCTREFCCREIDEQCPDQATRYCSPDEVCPKHRRDGASTRKSSS